MLVAGASDEAMAALAQRVLEAVRQGSSVRVSVGWAIELGADEQLLNQADHALAEAKRGGKDRALSATSS